MDKNQSKSSMIPSSICMPPDSVVVPPPVETRAHLLPFEELTWQNFERLLYRLASLEADVEHCAQFGRSGQAQQGIDVYARRTSGKYVCWQAKNRSAFRASDVVSAVDDFVNGSWCSRSEQFVLCVRSGLDDVTVQEEAERQAVRLQALGVTFRPLGGVDLSTLLRAHAALVDDFFGRDWVRVALGEQEARSLGTRLTGERSVLLRRKLGEIYDAKFRSIDPGLIIIRPGSVARDVRERFVAPDLSSNDPFSEPILETTEARHSESVAAELEVADDGPEQDDTGSARFNRKEILGIVGSEIETSDVGIALEDWLLDGHQKSLLLGGAGLGKSTALRCLALDVLKAPVVFTRLAAKLSGHIRPAAACSCRATTS